MQLLFKKKKREPSNIWIIVFFNNHTLIVGNDNLSALPVSNFSFGFAPNFILLSITFVYRQLLGMN